MVSTFESGPRRSEYAASAPVRAAQYVRMSTEHQRYSTENQSEVIAQYAAQHGFNIVRTYADNGKSGLRIEGRAALRQLIADVESGCAGFQAIFVYDVSRWGRFQDADESAYTNISADALGLRCATVPNSSKTTVASRRRL